MIFISACLLGIRCRYDNKILTLKANDQKLIRNLIKKQNIIPICPEQLGGLSTPRLRAKITNGKVRTENGIDVTNNFHKGAREVVKIVKLFGVKSAYLKSRSPSCGKNGITTQYLQKAKIKVYFI